MKNKVIVNVVILPNVDNLLSVKYYDYDQFGNVISDESEIRINKCETSDIETYSILYLENDFVKLKPEVLAANIVNVFASTIKDESIEFRLVYLFEENIIDNNTRYYDISTAVSVLNFGIKLDAACNNDTCIFAPTDTLTYAHEIMKRMTEDRYSMNEQNNDDILNMFGEDIDIGSDEDDDDDDKYDVKGIIDALMDKGSKSKKKYKPSRVIESSKHPKKMYNRHGVMVCNSRSAIRRDEKVIRSFLKDFIPGNSEWKKDFRDDLLERWMQMYVRTSKEIKYLEKKHRKQREKRKRISFDRGSSEEFARRIFNTANDIWNDPRR